MKVYLVQFICSGESAWSIDSAWATNAEAVHRSMDIYGRGIAIGAHIGVRVVEMAVQGSSSVADRMARAEPAVKREVQRRMAELCPKCNQGSEAHTVRPGAIVCP